MYKSKYPKLIEHFNDEHGLLLFDNEQKEIDSIIDNYLKEQLTLTDVVKSLKDKEPPHFYDWLKDNKVDFFDNLLLYKGDWLTIGDLYVKYKKEFKIPL